jgi:hypothetical protein
MTLQKFASEIFSIIPLSPYAALRNEVHLFVRVAVKPAWDQQVQCRSRRPAWKGRVGSSSGTRINNFVSDVGPTREPLTESGPQPMPRYYFNTRIGDELVADPEGEDLRNPDRAWEVARAMIRELLKTDGAERALLNATIEVTDDEGEIVLEFPFTEAILDLPDDSATRH